VSAVYLSLLLLMRAVLRRESAGPGIRDVLVVVLLAGGTLTAWDDLISWLTCHRAWARRVFQPAPLAVIEADGRIGILPYEPGRRPGR
jgi:hypothetical protein